MQLSSLLLHLADVLSRLLQRGGFTDLSRQRGGLQQVSDLPQLGTRWTFSHIYTSQQCSHTAARLHAVPWCLAESWASPQDYVTCQIPVWCWNAASAPRRCEWSSWTLLAADKLKKDTCVLNLICQGHAKKQCWCKSNETASSTLFISIFACPEKDACEDSGADTLSVRFGGDVWPGCRGKGTKRIIVN